VIEVRISLIMIRGVTLTVLSNNLVVVREKSEEKCMRK